MQGYGSDYTDLTADAGYESEGKLQNAGFPSLHKATGRFAWSESTEKKASCFA